MDILELFQRHLDGELDAAGTEQLRQALRDDPAALRQLAETCLIDAYLRTDLGENAIVRAAAQAGAQSVVEKGAGHSRLPASRQQGKNTVRLQTSATSPLRDLRAAATVAFHPITLMALVALVAVALGVLLLWPDHQQPQPVARVKPHYTGAPAVVSRTTLAQWDPSFAPTTKELIAGQRLKLASGFAEIVFASQAAIVLEGPAELTIVDATACRLPAGKLAANVPQPAAGFTVHTPSGTVTDLGTEFGVLVTTEANSANASPAASSPKSPAATEVHVFRGKVDVAEVATTKSTIHNPQSTILPAGSAVSLDAEGTVKPIPLDAQRFARVLPVAIPVTNGGFEDPSLADSGYPPLAEVSGWKASGFVMVYNPAKNNLKGAEGSGTPEGGERINVLALGGPNAGQIHQYPSNTKIAANTKYTLTTAVGWRLDLERFPSALEIRLRAGDTSGPLLASTTITPEMAGPAGTLHDFSISFHSSTFDLAEQIGKPLVIEYSVPEPQHVKGSPGLPSHQAILDNIRLTATKTGADR